MNLTKEIYIMKHGKVFSGPFFAKHTDPYKTDLSSLSAGSTIEYDISEIEKECERLNKLEPSDNGIWLPTYSLSNI